MSTPDSLTDAITFRPWRPADVPALVRHANNPRIAVNMKDRFPHPYTAEDGEQWVALNLSGERAWRSFAVDRGGEAIGGVMAEPGTDIFRRTADISYWVAEPYWSRGVGTRAARFISEYALANLPVVRLQALVFEWNPASGRVLEKAGFSLEGRLRQAVTKGGRTGDLLVYARLGASASGA
jgi:[ribosomal protein S5]-alanine N-acetyltransferase